MSDMNFGVNLFPDQTGTRDLGSSSKKWNNIYIDNINGTDVSNIVANLLIAYYDSVDNAIVFRSSEVASYDTLDESIAINI